MESSLLSFEECRVLRIVKGRSPDPMGPARVRCGSMGCLSDQQTRDSKRQRELKVCGATKQEQ